MKKIISLSLFGISSVLYAQNIIEISKKIDTKVVNDVSEDEIKSADLAESLTKNIPSISIVRRSGIANDIILRGAKKDNINIVIDDSKIYGACPNRMDPATSHVLTNNIKKVEVIEGPYDVEEFGTLSGKVKIETKNPSKDFEGEVNLNVGSFSYKKISTTLNAGTDNIKVLISASKESSDAYKDGDGNNFKEQQIANGVPSYSQYKKEDIEAFDKSTLLSKLTYNIDEDSELNLSFTANRSKNILYPNTPMDADYDDSNIYTIDYEKRGNTDLSKKFNINYYYSEVDHPMSTKYRNFQLSAMPMVYMTNHMNSSIKGLKLKNESVIDNSSTITYGVDSSIRNWKGEKYSTVASTGIENPSSVSLSSTDTKNKALFAIFKKDINNVNYEFGSRYDMTNIDTVDTTKTNREFSGLNAYLFTTINQSKQNKYFFGFGKSSRVPDARELYYDTANLDLKATKNYEIDLGFETKENMSILKGKIFYSVLKDFIYNNNGTTFENIDAKVYGFELSGTTMVSSRVSSDFGFAYTRGKKDEALAGQTDTNLAEIPPMKANVSINYDLRNSSFKTQIIAVAPWNSYDSDNGEQALGGYTVINMKYKNKISKSLEFTLGADNILDRTYTSTNTYNDIKYIGSGQTELINDPGRYFYTNIRYMF